MKDDTRKAQPTAAQPVKGEPAAPKKLKLKTGTIFDGPDSPCAAPVW
jgi:hypothetical protein